MNIENKCNAHTHTYTQNSKMNFVHYHNATFTKKIEMLEKIYSIERVNYKSKDQRKLKFLLTVVPLKTFQMKDFFQNQRQY